MNLNFTPEELAFQQEAQQFITEKYPKRIQDKVKRGLHLVKEDWVEWQKILHEKGWAGLNWPKEHGGPGWTPTQHYIWANECAKAFVIETMPFGLKMVAPVIYTYGNDEQKQRFLPDTLASNIWWCQGYSEPNAGSDLASLKTTAVKDGDEYVVNGTKTWTSYAHYADWIFCLVRTGAPSEKNQKAISFLLIDMKTPGITVSPIITIEGRHETNETYFDNVRVPAENLIGEEGRGWTYAKLLLTHERTSIARVPQSKMRLQQLKDQIKNTGNGQTALQHDSYFLQKIAEVELELLALEFTELRTLAAAETGKAPGPESSLLKIKGTEVAQDINELYVEAAGYYCLPFLNQQFEQGFDGDWIGPGSACSETPYYFNDRKTSIYGGSNEIQKNIICKAVLGL